MSTRIENGFRFRTADIFAVQGHVQAWRDELKPLHRAALASVAAQMAAETIDLHALAQAGEGRNTATMDSDACPLMDALRAIRERQKKIEATRLRDPGVDFGFEIMIIPDNGALLGMVFTERRDWLDAWMAKDFVEPWPYWSHTDRPDEVSDDEWTQRGEIWGRALGPAGVPSRVGFSAACVNNDIIPTGQEVAAVVRPSSERARALAQSAILGELLAERDDNEGGMLRIIAAAHRRLNEPEIAARVEAKYERIMEIIAPSITVDMLVNAPARATSER